MDTHIKAQLNHAVRMRLRALDWRIILLIPLLLSVLTACSINQNHSTAQHVSISLAPDDLETWGVAFMSPSTVTGREEDKQALAFIVGKVLTEERPDIRQVSLPYALGAINKAGLAGEYKTMFEDYRTTGIFDQRVLNKVGSVLNTRYVMQLNLASFAQGSQGRFSILGYRLFQTKHANIRIFIQIWDTKTGSIAWEGVEELILAEETTREKVINFTTVVEASARNLIQLLPESAGEPEQVSQKTAPAY